MGATPSPCCANDCSVSHGNDRGPAAVSGRRGRTVRLRPVPSHRTPAAAAARRVPDARPGGRLLRLGRRLRPRAAAGVDHLHRLAGTDPAGEAARPRANDLTSVKRLAGQARRRRPPWRVAASEIVDPGRRYPLPGLPGVSSNFDRPGYLEAVRRVIEYIHAGDCFQVNLSQRLLCTARTFTRWNCTAGCASATPPRSPATSTWAIS